MYKQLMFSGNVSDTAILRLSDNACIPFDPANTDYAEFKKAVMEGAELQDADGLVINAEVAKEFVRNLP